MKPLFLAVLLLLTGAMQAQSDEDRTPDQNIAERYLASMFEKAAGEWKTRIDQDETQRICTRYLNNPPTAEAEKILEREKAAIVFPQDGNVIGDWKSGEQIAQNGRGGQFSDTPNTVAGGNCYACHQLAPQELSYGTLGPSLLGYGKIRGFSRDGAKAAYAKIYDAQSAAACSQMPRFGYHKVLAERQIKDVVAYLFDPQSPVNK